MPALGLSKLLLAVRAPDLAPSPETEANGNSNDASGEATSSHAASGTIAAVVVFVGLILLAALFSAQRLFRKKTAGDEEKDGDLELPDYTNTKPLPPLPVRTVRRPFPVQEPSQPINMPPRRAKAATRPIARRPARYTREGSSLDIGDPNVTRATRIETSSRSPYAERQANWPLRASTERALAGDRPSDRSGSSDADVAAQVPLPQSYTGELGDSFEQVDLTPPVIRASQKLQRVVS